MNPTEGHVLRFSKQDLYRGCACGGDKSQRFNSPTFMRGERFELLEFLQRFDCHTVPQLTTTAFFADGGRFPIARRLLARINYSDRPWFHGKFFVMEGVDTYAVRWNGEIVLLGAAARKLVPHLDRHVRPMCRTEPQVPDDLVGSPLPVVVVDTVAEPTFDPHATPACLRVRVNERPGNGPLERGDVVGADLFMDVEEPGLETAVWAATGAFLGRLASVDMRAACLWLVEEARKRKGGIWPWLCAPEGNEMRVESPHSERLERRLHAWMTDRRGDGGRALGCFMASGAVAADYFRRAFKDEKGIGVIAESSLASMEDRLARYRPRNEASVMVVGAQPIAASDDLALLRWIKVIQSWKEWKGRVFLLVGVRDADRDEALEREIAAKHAGFTPLATLLEGW